MDAEAQLRDRIASREAIVGVVGLGYVGLPLARAFCDARFRVLGFDVDESKIDLIASGTNYLGHLGDDFVSEMSSTGRFEATSDFDRLGEADAVLICVPTPLDESLQPDLSYVVSTTEAVAKELRAGQLVVLESTTYPGTTREEVLPRLEAGELRCGEDFFAAFSPEREDPGRKGTSTQTIPKLVGGVDERSGELARVLYSCAVSKVHLVSSSEVAEAAKLLENVYRAVNIALANEMKLVLGAMDIDVWEVIEAASTKPFGYQAFYPGPGLGGHCIPIDPFYLSHRARRAGQPTRFIELAGEINRAMPDHVIRRVTEALGEDGKAVRGSKILVLGLAYKPNVADARESPALELVARLQRLGADVCYNDPLLPESPRTRRHDLGLSSVDVTSELLVDMDCVLVATDHDGYDWQLVAEHARLVVDTRNAMAGCHPARARVTKA